MSLSLRTKVPFNKREWVDVEPGKYDQYSFAVAKNIFGSDRLKPRPTLALFFPAQAWPTQVQMDFGPSRVRPQADLGPLMGQQTKKYNNCGTINVVRVLCEDVAVRVRCVGRVQVGPEG